jgi:hypothetical protein
VKRVLFVALLFTACGSETTNPGDPPTDASADVAASGGGSAGGTAGGSGGVADAASDAMDWCQQPFCPDGVVAQCCNCMQLKCNPAFQACRCSEDCRELEECLRLCAGNDVCVGGCYDDHPEGTPLFAAFVECGEGSCYDECY